MTRHLPCAFGTVLDRRGATELRATVQAYRDALTAHREPINRLNVYPVPDGDTGTNMMLTMRSTMEEAFRAPDHSATGVASAMARGALMGARGNSGVILSQIWRGLARGLEGRDNFTAADFAEALKQASDVAYNGVSNPVEGTMLTVIRDAAAAAQAKVTEGETDIVEVLEATVAAAGAPAEPRWARDTSTAVPKPNPPAMPSATKLARTYTGSMPNRSDSPPAIPAITRLSWLRHSPTPRRVLVGSVCVAMAGSVVGSMHSVHSMVARAHAQAHG